MMTGHNVYECKTTRRQGHVYSCGCIVWQWNASNRRVYHDEPCPACVARLARAAQSYVDLVEDMGRKHGRVR